MKKRIKHNNLLPWFTQDHGTLPRAYLASCEKFFKEISSKRQAPSYKRQASSSPAGTTSGCKKIKKDLTSFKQPGTVG
jgi:hypothetical protein